MNNKNKIGALAVKCEEQKERILELESELRRAKYNQEICDVTENRLLMRIKYLEGQTEAFRYCIQSITQNMALMGSTIPKAKHNLFDKATVDAIKTQVAVGDMSREAMQKVIDHASDNQ